MLADGAFRQQALAIRKHRSLTQQALADLPGLNVIQIRGYETGASQPSIAALKKIAVALGISGDSLLFYESERGPNRPSLRERLAVVDELDEDEVKVIESVLDGLLLRQAARRFAASG